MGAVAEMAPEFRAQMKRLIGLRFFPADLTTHWEVLRDCPHDLLVRAVTKAQTACTDFPTPQELLHLARSGEVVTPEADRSRSVMPFVITHPSLPVRIPVTREWEYYCDECHDAGRRSYWCGPDSPARRPWIEQRHCERADASWKAHNGMCGHEWVQRCECADTNPAVLRRQRAVTTSE